MIDLARLFGGHNEGERLLIEVSDALNSGKLPSKEAIKALDGAVTAMLGETDPQMRVNMFLDALGMANPAHRPPASASQRQQQRERARSFWFHRLQGDNVTKSRDMAAAEHECDPRTIKRAVDKYPSEGRRAFGTMRALIGWSDDESRDKADIVKRYFNMT